jgi:putative transposase
MLPVLRWRLPTHDIENEQWHDVVNEESVPRAALCPLRKPYKSAHRNNMVKHPVEYRWASYRANAQGEIDPLVQPHASYDALGTDQNSRQSAYRELFRCELEPGMVDEIRRVTNGNLALGDQRFAAQIEAALGRRAAAGTPGRPRKVTAPAERKLF